MTQTKIKTSDYSSEDSPENTFKATARAISSLSAQQQQQQKVTETKTTTTTVTKTKKSGGSVATSTPKASNFVTHFASQYSSRGGGTAKTTSSTQAQSQSQFEQRSQVKEHTQNVLNSEKELSKSKSYLSGFLGNSFSADNLDASDHVAYLEYKKAGEYWK